MPQAIDVSGDRLFEATNSRSGISPRHVADLNDPEIGPSQSLIRVSATPPLFIY